MGFECSTFSKQRAMEFIYELGYEEKSFARCFAWEHLQLDIGLLTSAISSTLALIMKRAICTTNMKRLINLHLLRASHFFRSGEA